MRIAFTPFGQTSVEQGRDRIGASDPHLVDYVEQTDSFEFWNYLSHDQPLVGSRTVKVLGVSSSFCAKC